MPMKLAEHLSDKEIEKLKGIKKKQKKDKKMSHRELLDLMGVHRDTYKRVRGAIRRK
jgi:hypothetical protein